MSEYIGISIKTKLLYWNFNINRKEDVDAFMLVAFDNIESLVPKHIWLVRAKEILEGREFWDRNRFILYNNVISRMRRYELRDELESLKDIMAMVGYESKKDNDIHRVITKKQNEILGKIGEKRSIKEIVEQAIMAGIDKIEY